MKERKWSYKELDILRWNYSSTPVDDLAKRLKRTPGAVKTRAQMMGLKKEKASVWTPQKIKLLTDFYDLMFNDALAKWIVVSERTLKRKAKELGLTKSPVFYKRKKEALKAKQAEGLKKVECATRFKKGVRRSPATEFKKGHKPSAEIIAKRVATRKRNLAKRTQL
jgi:hypothetical protein